MRFVMIFAVLGLLVSCDKDKDDFNMEEFWECNQSLALDSAGATARLAGSWTWKSQSCMMNGRKDADREVVATFNASGSYQLKENGLVVDQAGWRVRPYSSGGWRLEITYPSPTITPQYFYGNMMFCSNKVMFSSSPVDGCDYLFEKN